MFIFLSLHSDGIHANFLGGEKVFSQTSCDFINNVANEKTYSEGLVNPREAAWAWAPVVLPLADSLTLSGGLLRHRRAEGRGNYAWAERGDADLLCLKVKTISWEMEQTH